MPAFDSVLSNFVEVLISNLQTILNGKSNFPKFK